MKWQIAPEYRQEYWKKQARKGASSAPSSPASGKEVNPNFRGPNGQNLGYDTTMVSQFSAKDMSDRPVPPPPAKMHFNHAPPTTYNSSQPAGPTSTPQRHRTDTLDTIDTLDSPISPYHSHPPSQPTPGRLPTYTLPSSVPRPQLHSPSNPTLSSTPFPTSQAHAWPNSMATPAPLRQNPRLAPPSTLVAPSKFMPDSSPGGPNSFWKQLGIMNSTPARGVDISPLKTDAEHEQNRHVMSSSPPPMESGSPSKIGRSSQVPVSAQKENGVNVNMNGGFKLESNGNSTHGISVLPSGPTKAEDDSDDDGPGGFDLARGFAPIGAKAQALRGSD
jgi:forkhead protein FKH